MNNLASNYQIWWISLSWPWLKLQSISNQWAVNRQPVPNWSLISMDSSHPPVPKRFPTGWWLIADWSATENWRYWSHGGCTGCSCFLVARQSPTGCSVCVTGASVYMLPDGTKPLPEPVLTLADVCRLTASLGHNELTVHCINNCNNKHWFDSDSIIGKLNYLIDPWEILLNFSISYFCNNVINLWMGCLIWNSPQVVVTRLYWWLVNIGSGNGLVPSGNKPLPEPMLSKITVAIWRH